MKVMAILAHPSKDSFNHAIAQTAIGVLRKYGHEVYFHDLYEEDFDPVLPGPEIPEGRLSDPVIVRHCEEAAEADAFLVVHPNWWGQPPAILKGWVDRVFRVGVGYCYQEGDDGSGAPVGLLKAKLAVVFNTSDTLPEREAEVFGDPLETLWRNCIFGFCGVPEFHRKTFGVVVTSTRNRRRQWLREAQETVGNLFPGKCNSIKISEQG